MKKIFKIIILNIFLILFIWFACDIAIYTKVANERKNNPDFQYNIPPFTYMLKPYFGINMDECFSGEGKIIFGGRKPDGNIFKNNPNKITLFGCSYAVGQFLDTYQTFSYKLSEALKCQVFNRALPGKGFQHMYLQSTLDSFYNTVPPSNTVIYVMINDHYRRMLLNHVDILDNYIVINYKKNGQKLEELNYNNPLRLLFNSSYLVKLLKSKYVENYIEDYFNEEAITDKALCYFVETKKNLEKGWGKNFNFTVLFYGDIKYEKTLKDKLIKNGFSVIRTKRDFGLENTDLEKYYSLPDGHPNEAAWDKITPLMIERLELK